MFAFPIYSLSYSTGSPCIGPATRGAIDTGWFETEPGVSSDWERISLQGPVIYEVSISSSPFGLPAALGKKSLGMGEMS